MNLYREISMKTAALGENWRQGKRWAWRHLNFAHPGGRSERNDAEPVISAMAQRAHPVAKAPARTLVEHRKDEMKAQSATLDAARTAWEAHDRTRVTPASNAGALFRAPVHRVHNGLHAITPIIIVQDADKAVDFLERAFGFRENYRLTTREGKVAHCELQLEDSIVNLGESMDGWPTHGLVAQLHVKDPDALFDQAVLAGATAVVPMADTCLGSREGRVADPIGNVWIIATHTEEVSTPEMQRRMAAQSGTTRRYDPAAAGGYEGLVKL